MEFGSGRRGRRCPAPPTGQRGRRGLTTAAVFIAIHNGRRRPSRSSWWKIRTHAVDRELHAAWRLRPDGLAAPGMGQAHPPKGPTDSSSGRNAVLDINAIRRRSRLPISPLNSSGNSSPVRSGPTSAASPQHLDLPTAPLLGLHQPNRAHRPMRRGVGAHLRAVLGDVLPLDQAQSPSQANHLREQGHQRLKVPFAEGAEGTVSTRKALSPSVLGAMTRELTTPGE